jgi:hypothetical protein
MIANVARVFLFGLTSLLAMGGCSSSPWGNAWSSSYSPGPLNADAYAAPGLITPQVHQVMPDAMARAMDEEEKFLASRSRTRQSASPVDQRDLQRIQFPILGLYNDPGTMMLMGTSEVVSDKQVLVTDPAIGAAAKEVGASLVVVSAFPPGSARGLPLPPPDAKGKVEGQWRGVAWYYAPARELMGR